VSDYNDDDIRGEEPDISRSPVGKDTLWWFVMVLFMGVTVGLIHTVFIAGIVVGAIGLALVIWDESRGGGRRGRKITSAPGARPPGGSAATPPGSSVKNRVHWRYELERESATRIRRRTRRPSGRRRTDGL
jgi:hypothetical protein